MYKSRHLGYEPCPKCVENGRDRRGDNLSRWSDGSLHCWSCGYHRFPKLQHRLKMLNEEDENAPKTVLPPDFTREVPADAWKWLLKYGLPYSYWKPYIGYSPSHKRLVFTFGNPVRFSIGRSLEPGQRKWMFWGNGHRYVELIGESHDRPIVLVEDIISAHKVGQRAPCLCLFGTHIHDEALKLLIHEKKPVLIWLDKDQYSLLPAKVNRLKTFLDGPVGVIYTDKDPKEYSVEDISKFLESKSKEYFN